MRVLVTGAGGYVGGAVVAALAAAGHEPVGLVRGAPKPDQVRGDLLDAASLRRAVAGTGAVCHLAGLTRVRESWDDALRYFEVNVGGTLALLRALADAGVPRLVFASTGSVYGTPERQPMAEDAADDPPHPYAASKAAAEAAVRWQARAAGLDATVLRLFNVAGGADPDRTRIVPRVLAVAAGAAPCLEVNGDGTAVRDYVHVADVAAAFVAALAGPRQGGKYNIGSGTGASVLDVVAAARRVTGRDVPVVHRAPAAEPPRLVCDPSLAAAELGWRARRSDLDTIVRDAWAAAQ